MELFAIEIDSEWLNNVKQLGDSCSSTVGFLPSQAYNDYAKHKNIIVAIEDNTLAGYLMFRITNNRTTIVHLCISIPYRKKGVAKKLVNYLYKLTESTLGVILNCRRDYELNEFWTSLGFTPISEKKGRAKNTNTSLTTWYKKNNHVDLFTYLDRSDSRIIAVLDTNIIIDLSNNTDKESMSLTAPYLNTLVKFKICKEVLIEIDQNNDHNKRNYSREYAKRYDLIDNIDKNECERIFEVIKKHISKGSIETNTKYDISLIATSIVIGASAFITRDEVWLKEENSAFIFEKFGLRILSPGQFIVHIDELFNTYDYYPKRLMGLNLEYSQMPAESLNLVAQHLQEPSKGKLAQFKKLMRELMAEPYNNELLLVKKNDKSVFLTGFSHANGSGLIVKIFRFSKEISTLIKTTFIKRIGMKLIEKAVEYNCKFIFIPENCIDIELTKALIECGFFNTDKGLYRFICPERYLC